jgi:hypothetical protein
MTLIGKAGKWVDKGSCVMTTMHSEKVPALPKGLPAPNDVPTSYVVSIESYQWKVVAATVDEREDRLIIEGYPQLDVETGTIAVFATSTTSREAASRKTLEISGQLPR